MSVRFDVDYRGFDIEIDADTSHSGDVIEWRYKIRPTESGAVLAMKFFPRDRLYEFEDIESAAKAFVDSHLDDKRAGVHP